MCTPFVPPREGTYLHVTDFYCINQIDMAEGGSDLGSDPDGNETLSSYTEGPPSVADVLAMTVDELRPNYGFGELVLWEGLNLSCRQYSCRV